MNTSSTTTGSNHAQQDDERFMNMAIKISAESEFPFGAVVVKDGEIIGRSDADTASAKSIYSHAEQVAIENASGNELYRGLKGATLYCSCEPCMMCMGVILYEGIDRVCYAAGLEDSDNLVEREIPVGARSLAALAGSDIKISSGHNRLAAVAIMKKYQARKEQK
jgi:guanine deaminase